jgi:hypothetical protein
MNDFSVDEQKHILREIVDSLGGKMWCDKCAPTHTELESEKSLYCPCQCHVPPAENEEYEYYHERYHNIEK